LFRLDGKVPRVMKLTIPTCGDACGKISKSTPVLVAIHCARYDFTETETFECGHCSNQDSWTLLEMLWDEESEHLVTPCCHTEAITALVPDNPKDDYDQAREDYQSYVWAVSGR